MADFNFRHRRASCLAHSTGRDAKTWVSITAAHLTGAGGIQNFKMLPATPVVNSSIEDYVTPLIWPCNEHPIGSNRLVMQCNN